ncbi:hypothetical protein SYJ56_04475 [Algoriphagus sp. D3-2-R+10]|uniref:hypothetical protein n=1 Tax=Algoriphagus aurantiacus TaxID=3103948 RepID=UPI002B38225E|nr:hypothetical protein [Algoriphagus sp. D3-2-R+10]MEB2774547.1 hypothetical protein [Algoriphagus sp. D3-2-R+10]
MKKLILFCFLISGFAFTFAGPRVPDKGKMDKFSMCPPEEMQYESFTTTCGKTAVASGCNITELLEDAAEWESFHCG